MRCMQNAGHLIYSTFNWISIQQTISKLQHCIVLILDQCCRTRVWSEVWFLLCRDRVWSWFALWFCGLCRLVHMFLCSVLHSPQESLFTSSESFRYSSSLRLDSKSTYSGIGLDSDSNELVSATTLLNTLECYFVPCLWNIKYTL